ncbi:MAG TPA: hypothetical protein VKP64_05350 [Mycobacteriales bacterium]|nr:hypothetical protein [Mycobacteriales bacterium]
MHLWWVGAGVCAWIVVDLILVLVIGRAARLGEPSYATTGDLGVQFTAAAAAPVAEQVDRPA